MIEYALFDLDDTLYAPESGVLQAIGRRIERYLVERMGMEPEAAARLRAEYRAQYGTTLAGLLANGTADPEDYLAFVHDVPIEQLLRPSAEVKRALAGLPWRRVIVTNSDLRHVERVLAALGIDGLFDRVFDIRVTEYRQKPHPAVYGRVLAELGAEGPQCLIVDDSLANLLPAKEREMTTVWVGRQASLATGVDYAIPHVVAVAEVAAQVQARERLKRGG
ncbi:MAG: pyrimidine 5'-nucleotidase [Anaerolineae bacterium]|nr:pyrimidine 5'-nucleotidase [Anaerolineae bacterium]